MPDLFLERRTTKVSKLWSKASRRNTQKLTMTLKTLSVQRLKTRRKSKKRKVELHKLLLPRKKLAEMLPKEAL